MGLPGGVTGGVLLLGLSAVPAAVAAMPDAVTPAAAAVTPGFAAAGGV